MKNAAKHKKTKNPQSGTMTKIPYRIITMGLLVLAQIVLVVVFMHWLSALAFALYFALQAIAVVVVFFIINRSENPNYKITWIIFIMAVPMAGVVFYILFGSGSVLPKKRRTMSKIEDEGSKYLDFAGSELALTKLKNQDHPHARQAIYLSGTSGYPLYSDSSAVFLSPGEEIYKELLYQLKRAKNYIFIEFFILAEGEMWDKIYDILLEKVKDGVEIRVMYDDFGSNERLRRGFAGRLRKKGIHVAVFNPISPSMDGFMNYRSHRKSVIVDGETVMTGGFNVGDEYINRWERFGHWMDSAIMLSGAPVDSFIVMFINMWRFITGETMGYQEYMPKRYNFDDVDADDALAISGFSEGYCDGPLTGENPAKGIYMQMLGTASKYCYITTPYLILDNEMINELTSAARSGVDVRIITPAIPDKWYVHPVTRYNYGNLLKCGIRVFEYTPGFIHSKMFVSDDRVATVGTVNMDYRSFYFHFECGVWICDQPAVMDVKRNITDIMEVCHEITLKEFGALSHAEKLKQWLLHLFSPFL